MAVSPSLRLSLVTAPLWGLWLVPSGQGPDLVLSPASPTLICQEKQGQKLCKDSQPFRLFYKRGMQGETISYAYSSFSFRYFLSFEAIVFKRRCAKVCSATREMVLFIFPAWMQTPILRISVICCLMCVAWAGCCWLRLRWPRRWGWSRSEPEVTPEPEERGEREGRTHLTLLPTSVSLSQSSLMECIHLDNKTCVDNGNI